MEDLIGRIEEAAREAGRIILREGGAREFRKEGHFNFVTEADLHVQEALKRCLGEILPEAVFYAEEQENARLTEAFTWIVDPIDGTLNFMRSRDCSAVSIALLKDREPVAGVIYDPFRDEMFAAEKGRGAYRNGHRLAVPGHTFENAMIAFGTSPYNSALARETMARATRFLLEAGDLRRTGSAAIDLCSVACGRSDVFFELQLSPWDFAAGALIVEEAGGVFLQFREKERTFDKKTAILACCPSCLKDALRILNGGEINIVSEAETL